MREAWGDLLNKPDRNDKYFSSVLLFGQLVISYIKYFYQGIRRKKSRNYNLQLFSVSRMWSKRGRRRIFYHRSFRGCIRSISSTQETLRGPRRSQEDPISTRVLLFSPSLNLDPGKNAFTAIKPIQLVLKGNRLLVFSSYRKLFQYRSCSIDVTVCPLQENTVECP